MNAGWGGNRIFTFLLQGFRQRRSFHPRLSQENHKRLTFRENNKYKSFQRIEISHHRAWKGKGIQTWPESWLSLGRAEVFGCKIKKTEEKKHMDGSVAKHQHWGEKKTFPFNLLRTNRTDAFGAEGQREDWNKNSEKKKGNNFFFLVAFLFLLQRLKKLNQKQPKQGRTQWAWTNSDFLCSCRSSHSQVALILAFM